MEDFNIAYLAKLSNLSESHFRKTFKDLTSFSPAKYRNRLRIEQAMSLLVNTNLNINEISCEVGFTYPRYFSSTFKSVTGMTPKQFRNEKCNK